MSGWHSHFYIGSSGLIWANAWHPDRVFTKSGHEPEVGDIVHLHRLTEWAENPKTELPDAVRQKILGLKIKAPAFQVAFDLPDAARTSNTVDRLMNYQDRLLDAMQYFHGSLASANQAVRAMALL